MPLTLTILIDMKMKITGYLAGLMAIAVIACTKEMNIETMPVNQSPSGGGVFQTQEDEGFSIIGNITDEPLTKTQYTYDEGIYTFSWTANDEIQLIVYNTSSNQNQYRLTAETTASSSKFKDNQSNEKDPIGSIVTGGWLQTGFAIYVQNSSLSYVAQGAKISNVVVSLSQSSALGSDPDMNTQLSRTPLVGNREGETNVYNFGTATGVIKITLNDVPTTATELRLTSPSDEAPLSGTFNLVSGSPEIRMTKKASGNRTRSVTFSLTSVSDRTFYIPVPVGTIPVVNGHSLKIELLAGDVPILTKSYKKDLTIERNKVIPVTFDVPEYWMTIGTAKFYDKGPNSDWGYYYHADVVMEQSVSNPNNYRLVNPYGAYKTVNEVSNAYASGDYLNFTVDPSTDLVTFEEHATGLGLDSKAIVLRHPTVSGKWDGTKSGSAEYNKVRLKDGSGNPLVVQLAPYYCYSDMTNGWPRIDKNHHIEIIFPGYTVPANLGISSSSSVLDDNLVVRVTGDDLSNVSTFKVGCARNFSDSYKYLSSAFSTSETTTFSGYNGLGLYTRELAVVAYNSDGTEIGLARVDKTIYSITSAAKTELEGTYDMTTATVGEYSNGVMETGDVNLAISDDVFSGNIIMTKFAGRAGKIYGNAVAGSVTFSRDQLFGDNPYDASKSTYPSIALVSYNNTAVDIVFTRTNNANLTFSGQNIGFRATSSELWSSYDGLYPWVISFGELVLTKR